MELRDLEKRVAAAVKKPPWNRKSTLEIARRFRCSPDLVFKVRTQLGCMPETIEYRTASGQVRTMRLGAIGKRNGKSLNNRQEELLSQGAEWAQELARMKANDLLNEEELIGVANEALVVAARYWRGRSKGRRSQSAKKSAWRGYARRGIVKAFQRAFAKARARLRREQLFNVDSSADEENREIAGTGSHVPDPHNGTTLLEQLRELIGMPRLVNEWVSGIDGGKPWGAEEIAEFWGCDVARAKTMIEEAKEALVG